MNSTYMAAKTTLSVLPEQMWVTSFPILFRLLNSTPQIPSTYETRDPRERSHEPIVGEKRPREEDPQDEKQPSREPPRSSSSFGNQDVQAQGNVPANVPIPKMDAAAISAGDNPEGHDALYIGDLQWVCCCPLVALYLILNAVYFV